jgi:hypothetical protein
VKLTRLHVQLVEGKATYLSVSSDVASALSMAGVLDYTPAMANNLQVDDTGNTFAGTIGGRMKVYIDPYFEATNGTHFLTVGYKGSSSPFDAGSILLPIRSSTDGSWCNWSW